MEHKDLIEKIKAKQEMDDKQKLAPFFLHTIAWFQYLGLLRHNQIPAKRFKITLEDALRAGKLEPRVLELLPAVMIEIPDAIEFQRVPSDLREVINAIQRNNVTKKFRGVEPDKYVHWVKARIFEIARRRLYFHRLPRKSLGKTHAIGEFIREKRINLALTQQQFAEQFKVSLRAIRDLEQGKEGTSIKSTNAILKALGHSLHA